MKKAASVHWKTIRKTMIEEDPELAAALEEIAPEVDMARQLIKARLDCGLTQKELAEKVGTQQSNVSRMERGQQNVSIELLNKVAKGLGKKLRISIG